MTPRELIEAVRARADVREVVARRVKLKKAGGEWEGLCPFHSEKTASFRVVPSKGFYHCFGCGAHGDAIKFVMDCEGLDFLGAVRVIAADLNLASDAPGAARSAAPVERQSRKAAPEGRQPVDSVIVAREMWKRLQGARGTIVEAWLEARGLDLAHPQVQLAIDALRFLPDAPMSAWMDGQGWADARVRAPAMVGRIERFEAGAWRAIGLHVTYLAPDGRSKAHSLRRNGSVRPARKMLGDVGGGAVWLTPRELDAPLVVGEGKETSVSAAIMLGRVCRVAAALSLNNLQGAPIMDKAGALVLTDLRPDPERRSFVFPAAGEVLIAVDADMKPMPVRRDAKGRASGPKLRETRRAPIICREITSLERSTICAALARRLWLDAGASEVRCIRPRMGLDFNDSLRGQ